MKFISFTILALLLSTLSQAQLIGKEKSLLGIRYTYENESLNRIKMTTLMKSNDEAYKIMKQSNKLAMVGLIGGGVGGGLVAYQIGIHTNGGTLNRNLVVIGVGVFILFYPLAVISSYKMKRAVEKYNLGLLE